MAGEGIEVRYRIWTAAACYAGVLFVMDVITGTASFVRLDPALDATASAVVGSGLFMPVILFGGTMIPAALRLTGDRRALLATGLIALALFLCADMAAGLFLWRLSPAEHLSLFLHEPGLVRAGALGIFTLFPWLWWSADRNRSGIHARQPPRGFRRSGP